MMWCDVTPERRIMKDLEKTTLHETQIKQTISTTASQGRGAMVAAIHKLSHISSKLRNMWAWSVIKGDFDEKSE